MSGHIASEVGAVFLIEDRATLTLDKISAGLSRVETGIDAAKAAMTEFADVRFGNLTRSLGALFDRLDQVAVAADRVANVRFGGLSQSVRATVAAVDTLDASVSALPATFASSMTRVVAEANAATASIRALGSAMFQANTQAAGIGAGLGGPRGPGPRGPGGGGGGGGGGRGGPHGRMHISPGGVGAGVGQSMGMGDILAFGGGLLGYEMVKHSAVYDQALRNAAMNLGVVDPDSAEGVAVRNTLDQTLRQSTQGTQFSLTEAAPHLSDFYGLIGSGLSGTPTEKASQFQGLTSQAMRFAEAEVKAGHGSLESNLQSFGEFSHLLRKYQPEQMGHVSDQLLAISRMTGKDPLEIERVMKYSVTTGGLAGIDTDELLSMTGFLMQSGITGTTAGTGLAAIVQQILKGEQEPSKQQRSQLNEALQERRHFQDAIHGRTGVSEHVARAAKEPASRAALEKLGVMDPSSHKLRPEFQDEHGGMKEAAIILQMAHKTSEMPGHTGGVLIEQALGQRGSRAVEPFMGEGGRIFQQYLENEKMFTEKLGVLATQAGQAAGAMGEFQQLGARFSDFGVTLMRVGGDENSPLARLGKSALLAAQGLETVTNALKGIGGVPEVPANIEQRLRERGKFAPGSDLERYNDPNIGGKYIRGTSVDPGLSTAPPLPPPADLHPNSGGGAADDVLHHSSFRGGGGSNVHIENIHFGAGTSREHAEEFARYLSQLLSRNQQNDLGTGGGHNSSTYTSGGGVSI